MASVCPLGVGGGYGTSGDLHFALESAARAQVGFCLRSEWRLVASVTMSERHPDKYCCLHSEIVGVNFSPRIFVFDWKYGGGH